MLGKRLKELRGKRTQQEIADSLGVSRASYSHYENDHVQPDNETLTKLAVLYAVSVDHLLGRETKESSIEETELKKEKAHYANLIANIEDPVKREQAIAFLKFLANSPSDGAKK